MPIPLITLEGFNLRLEPRSRVSDLTEGSRARTADPLWMLARQWQSGEFQGEDAGSPIGMELQYSSYALDMVKLNGEATYNKLANQPLEQVVEQEYPEIDWRTSIRVGQQFEKLLRGLNLDQVESVLQFYRKRFPVKVPAETDEATRQLVQYMEGKVVNGRSLLEWLGKNGDLSKIPPKEGGVTGNKLNELGYKLLEWCQKLNIPTKPQPHTAWRNGQLDYRFQVSGQSSGVKGQLVAPGYQNGDLEWYQFNASDSIKNVKWQAGPLLRTLPTRLKLRGTSLRWWEFEDAVLDFGHLDKLEDTELAKLMMMQFVLFYSDDWYSFTLPVEMSSLVRIDAMRVRNVFGEVHDAKNGLIPAQVLADEPLQRWEVFTLAPASVDDSGGVRPGLGNTRTPGIEIFDRSRYLQWQAEHAQLRAQILQPGLATAQVNQIKKRSAKVAGYLQSVLEQKKSILFVPPVAGFREESVPLEEIRFLRDEGANMVWAIEHTVCNGLGQPVAGFDAHRAYQDRPRFIGIRQIEHFRKQLNEPGLTQAKRAQLEQKIVSLEQFLSQQAGKVNAPIPGVPLYRLASTVPGNWIPFIPKRVNTNIDIRLRQAQMPSREDEKIAPLSSLLPPIAWVEESAIPRAGRRLLLTAQRVRWVDGSTYTWIGRKVLTGKGEGSSGLRFDVLK